MAVSCFFLPFDETVVEKMYGKRISRACFRTCVKNMNLPVISLKHFVELAPG